MTSDGPHTIRQAPVATRRLVRLRLGVVDGPDKGKTLESDAAEPVTVGTSPDNDLVLGDPTISRYHLELARADGGVLVRDLGSLNGTFAGPMRLERAVVPLGARITLGATSLAIEDGAPATPRAEAAAPEIAGLVGESAAMREVRRLIARLAGTSASVLVTGETGTGKERVARALHDLSARAREAYVVVDCGSLPPTLIASELFGHERGAFTGADRRHIGAFERASGGTVFLDEIGELPLAVQPALLGVLERRRIRRVGGDREIDVDVRVVSATHRDLRAEVNQSSFRADLYFRLAVARIAIPPLRERPEDIAALVQHFVEEITGSADQGQFFGPQTLEALRQHRWTGNVRELRNVVESALAMGRVTLEETATGEASRKADTRTPPAGVPITPAPAGAPMYDPANLPSYRDARADALTRFEIDYLSALMDSTEGNASEAARKARMDRPYLLSLLKRHGLRK